MFNIELRSGPRIDVVGRKYTISYANDGSLPNSARGHPHRRLRGCAACAKKACRELGIDDTGIGIGLKVVARPEQPLMPARLVTTLKFPERFTPEQRRTVIAAIEKCAVKALIQAGAQIEFSVGE
ncbi:MAG: hypothetical protein U1F11_02750 [Steroidobacteraceae bacterium]